MNMMSVQIRIDGVLKQSAIVPAVPTRTLNAIKEAKDIAAHPEDYKEYTDWDELMEELNASNFLVILIMISYYLFY